MSDLITTPTVLFEQGKIGDTNYETPIQVIYYNGNITLRQAGNYDQPEEVTIHPDFLNKLFREIKMHLPQANKHLQK